MQINLDQNFIGQRISGIAASLFLGVTLAILAGCGSGGAGGTPASSNTSTPGNPAPVGTAAAAIQLLSSSPQMPSSGASTVDLTAVVLSATNQAVSGRTVTFSIPGAPESASTSTFVPTDRVSDANGLVTAKLNLGTNKANRSITVTATADAASATNVVAVTGTTVTISGNSSLAQTAQTTLTFSVKDSVGAPLQGIAVSITSVRNNPIVRTPANGITDPSGQVTAVVTGSFAGSDTITASAAGAIATQALTVSGASFAFAAPATNAQIPLTGAGSTPTVTVNWTDSVTPPVGPVSFSISRGNLSAPSAPLLGGTASVTVSSTTAGPAIITASGPSGTPAATLDVIFVATSASSATVQANPGTVQVTTGSASQSNNVSTITAVVRDVNANLVKNAAVSFNLVDSSGGRLTSSTGTTDVSGTASVTYIAGPTSSALNGVTITATVDKVNGLGIAPVVTGATTLTVSGQSLLVRLGTDNKTTVTPLPQNANTNTYLAIVTDAALNPVGGITVQFTLRPGRYQKGTFVQDVPNNRWVQSVTVTCPNEDLNFNGSLDPGEGLVTFPAGVTPALRPGAVASVNATAVTDAFGFAIATVAYAKSFSLWSEVTLQARTTVTTNDPPTETTFFLAGAAADYTPLTIAPPPIPYGSNASCADTL